VRGQHFFHWRARNAEERNSDWIELLDWTGRLMRDWTDTLERGWTGSLERGYDTSFWSWTQWYKKGGTASSNETWN
jgi:hypothetical protein